MHGFFIDLRLYTKAKAIADPFQYAEYRKRLAADRMEKERESRIRSKGSTNKPKSAADAQVKVNKALIERLRSREEKERRKRSTKAGAILDSVHSLPIRIIKSIPTLESLPSSILRRPAKLE